MAMHAATVTHWKNFQQLGKRWQSIAAKSKVGTRLAEDLFGAFRKHRFLTTAAIAVVSGVLGAVCTYKFVGSDMPALRSEYQKVAGDVYAFRFASEAADAELRSSLRNQAAQEEASRHATRSSLRALTASVIALGAKAERRPLSMREASDLLASVREISVVETAGLESVTTIGGLIGDEQAPMLAMAKREEDLKEFATFFHAPAPAVQPAYLGKLLLTRNGRWHAGDRHLLFKWDGGSAKLRATRDLSQGEIARKAELFNAVSQAATQASPVVAARSPAPPQAPIQAGIAPRNFSPPPKPAPRPQSAPQPIPLAPGAVSAPAPSSASFAPRRYTSPRTEGVPPPPNTRLSPALAP